MCFLYIGRYILNTYFLYHQPFNVARPKGNSNGSRCVIFCCGKVSNNFIDII